MLLLHPSGANNRATGDTGLIQTQGDCETPTVGVVRAHRPAAAVRGGDDAARAAREGWGNDGGGGGGGGDGGGPGRAFASWPEARAALEPWYGAVRVDGWRAGGRIRALPCGGEGGDLASWWSDLNPLAMALARSTVLALSDGAGAWRGLAAAVRNSAVGTGGENFGEGGALFPVHVWVAGWEGTVCSWKGPGGVDDMIAQIPGACAREWPEAVRMLNEGGGGGVETSSFPVEISVTFLCSVLCTGPLDSQHCSRWLRMCPKRNRRRGRSWLCSFLGKKGNGEQGASQMNWQQAPDAILG